MAKLFKEIKGGQTNTFVDTFIQNVAKHPDKIAVADDDGTYTYRELDQISNGVAAKLLKHGIGKGDIVPILMTRGKGFVAAFIGVMKSGAVFAPIDTNFPSERITHIFKSVSAKVVIDDKWMSDLPIISENINRSCLDETAMLIYTSGSSSSPKGVIHTNKSLLAISKSAALSVSARKDKPYASLAPSAAISGMMEYLAYLYVGTTLFIASDRVRKETFLLMNWVRTFNITGFGCIPSVGKILIDEVELKDIEWILLAGERIDSVKNYNHITLRIQYGNSECGTCTCYNTRESVIMPPVGKPLPGVKVYIIDEEGMLVTSGNVGELCIAGSQVSKGYWKMPELTAEKFVHCPFLPGDVTMYKTGDLARYREDGNIEFVGRKDSQIKIRGNRIDPVEIENVAVRFDGIDTVVVTAKEIGEEKHLLLYYTSKAEIEENQLKEHLSRTLADYMVPNFYVRLNEMPRNANGKIDKNRLPEPKLGFYGGELDKPTTELEQIIFEAVAKHVGTSDFGTNDDLINMGLTSLSSMILSAELESQGVKMPTMEGLAFYNEIVRVRSVKGLAQLLSVEK